MTITEFLLARIAEDEAAALSATGEYWHGQACEVRTYPKDQDGATEPYWFRLAEMHHANHFNDGKHIARHDPARVLAECAAKRAVVQMALDSERYGYGTVTDGVKRETLGLAIRALASVYADHEDYRQEWAC